MTDAATCPVCKLPLIVRTSKRIGETVTQRRICKCCEYADVATLRVPRPAPATVINVRIVKSSCSTTTAPLSP